MNNHVILPSQELLRLGSPFSLRTIMPPNVYNNHLLASSVLFLDCRVGLGASPITATQMNMRSLFSAKSKGATLPA